jgi:hypothetical protein
MLGVFAEFERGIIRERVNVGIARAKAKGVTLGRPRIDPQVEKRIKLLRAKGYGLEDSRRARHLHQRRAARCRRLLLPALMKEGPTYAGPLCFGVGRCYAGLNLPFAATQSPLLIVAKP